MSELLPSAVQARYLNDHKTTCAPHMPSPTFMLARSLLHIQLCSGLYCGLAPLRATPDRSYAARLSINGQFISEAGCCIFGLVGRLRRSKSIRALAWYCRPYTRDFDWEVVLRPLQCCFQVVILLQRLSSRNGQTVQGSEQPQSGPLGFRSARDTHESSLHTTYSNSSCVHGYVVSLGGFLSCTCPKDAALCLYSLLTYRAESTFSAWCGLRR